MLAKNMASHHCDSPLTILHGSEVFDTYVTLKNKQTHFTSVRSTGHFLKLLGCQPYYRATCFGAVV